MGNKIPAHVIRLLIFSFGVLLFYAVIIVRLWDLQIAHGRQHRERISKQSVRKIRMPAARGVIYTSDMHILADNRPSYNVIFHISEMRMPGRSIATINKIFADVNRVAEVIGRKSVLDKDDIIRHVNLKPGLPITVFRDLNSRELANLSELNYIIPGMEIIAEPQRIYPEGKTASHIIGYVGRDDPSKAFDKESYFYYIPDIVGRYGIEKKYDMEVRRGDVKVRGLRGTAGTSVVLVDYLGFVYKTLGTPNLPVNGNNLVLTLDWDAQITAEKLLKNKRGAFILMNAETGAILAMVSSPEFNLEEFIPHIHRVVWNKLTNDPAKPLFNRAAKGVYNPGSIVKPLVALALLKNGVNGNSTVNCIGYAPIGNTRIHCWLRRGHGPVNLIDAIKYSCNVYFITEGVKIGFDKLRKEFASAGLGKKTGFPLPESKGVLPDRKLKLKKYHQKWNTFDTALVCIGQGMLALTPLQAAVYISAIANGGTLLKPYLLKFVKDGRGNTIFANKPVSTGMLDTNAKDLDMVREGMWRVVNAKDGTAKRARNKFITLYGKTGTAEVIKGKLKNTWFVCFGKYKNKIYTAIIFIEDGKSGGRTCAPIASQFFNKWISQLQNKQKNGRSSYD